jgi:hypothetical protein
VGAGAAYGVATTVPTVATTVPTVATTVPEVATTVPEVATTVAGVATTGVATTQRMGRCGVATGVVAMALLGVREGFLR